MLDEIILADMLVEFNKGFPWWCVYATIATIVKPSIALGEYECRLLARTMNINLLIYIYI